MSKGITPAEHTPVEVNMGEGYIAMTLFKDEDGAGVILTDTGEKHEVGSKADGPEEKYTPTQGDVLIRCSSKESATVLLRKVKELVRLF